MASNNTPNYTPNEASMVKPNPDTCDQFVWYVFGLWTIAAVIEAADVEWQRGLNGGATCKMSDAALRACAVLVDVVAASTVTLTVFITTLHLAHLLQMSRFL